MTVETPGLDRCPTCSAAVKPGDPWCTLCYADLRPAPPPPPPAAPPPPGEPEPLGAAPLVAPDSSPRYGPSVVVGPDPLTAPLDALSGPTWPCSTCGAVNAMDQSACSACGATFLSGLRDQQGPLLELPVVGDITRLGRGQRFALAAGVVVAFIMLTLLLGVLFG